MFIAPQPLSLALRARYSASTAVSPPASGDAFSLLERRSALIARTGGGRFALLERRTRQLVALADTVEEIEADWAYAASRVAPQLEGKISLSIYCFIALSL